MSIRRANPRKQGEIGLGAAIRWFTANGYAVAIPLADNQPWDLIVDDGEGPLRVQVKTTTFRNRRGRFEVHIDTAGGNQSFHTRKPFDKTLSDMMFVLSDDGSVHVIPCEAISGRTRLTLGAKYEQYRRDPQ